MKTIMEVIKENAIDLEGNKRDMSDMVLALHEYYKDKPAVDAVTVLGKILEAYLDDVIEW